MCLVRVHTIFLCSLIMLGCQDNSSKSQVPIVDGVAPSIVIENDREVLNEDVQELRNEILSFKKGDSVETLSIKVNKLYSLTSYDELKTMSNETWSGKTDTPRNPQVAAVIAFVLNDVRVEDWSLLRVGIAFHVGVGFEQDVEMAENYLSNSLLVNNATANYFLSKIKFEKGAKNEAQVLLERAAQLGHRKAKAELGIK